MKGTKKHGHGKDKQRLAIKNPNEDDNDSMPSLESCSDESEDDDDVKSSSEDDYYSDEQNDERESEYDTDDEDELRKLYRMAMEEVYANPDILEHGIRINEDILTDERKENPFLKLLGSLRGIFFRSLQSYIS